MANTLQRAAVVLENAPDCELGRWSFVYASTQEADDKITEILSAVVFSVGDTIRIIETPFTSVEEAAAHYRSVGYRQVENTTYPPPRELVQLERANKHGRAQQVSIWIWTDPASGKSSVEIEEK